jgi:hypothetical protein
MRFVVKRRHCGTDRSLQCGCLMERRKATEFREDLFAQLLLFWD